MKRVLKDKDEVLSGRLEQIKNEGSAVLNYANSAFPFYTPHGILHSKNVEEILNVLLPDEEKTKMNSSEIFFLLIAAWLHDWGMVAAPNEDPEQVRKNHHIRTEENFEQLHDKVFVTVSEGRIIGRICRGHRLEDLRDPRFNDCFFGNSIQIRVRFLSALLRLADECDVTANRTPEIVYCSIKPEGASKDEFDKHLQIIGMGKLNPYTLQVNGIAWTPKGAETIEKVRQKIQTELDSIKGILAIQGVCFERVEKQVDPRGFIDKPIEFSLDRQSIVKLLIGSSLYSRSDAAIRELVQNAIDTCCLRNLFSQSFNSTITIEFSKSLISIFDNGLGMNFDDANSFFSRKGQSFYVSKDLSCLTQGKAFDPISKFGIGVLSAFLIADKMVIETKKQGCSPCKFTIANLVEGWTYEEGSRNETGTKITLTLNDEGKKLKTGYREIS